MRLMICVLREKGESRVCLWLEQENHLVKSKLKDYTTEDFWAVVKPDISASIQSEIDKHHALVHNPFSHDNTERHEIKTELKEAIQAVKSLKSGLMRYRMHLKAKNENFVGYMHLFMVDDRCARTWRKSQNFVSKYR